MPTLKDAQDKVRELSQKALAVAEDSTLTFSDMKAAIDPLEADIKKWTEEVQSLSYVEEKRKQFAEAAGVQVDDLAGDNQDKKYKSIGEQFVKSPKYDAMVKRGFSGNWSSGDIELKTLLTEGTLGTPGGGYQIPNAVPQLIPGIVDIRFLQLTVADLFPNGATSSTLIRYLVETSLTNAAAAVAEGALKPESALAFSKVDEVLHKIATFLPISDEMLEDWAQAMSYIDSRLTLFVKQQEEVQLLRGDGTGANLVGLLNRTGLAPTFAARANTANTVNGVTGTLSPASDNDMDAIYRQITYIRTTAFLEPDAIVIDPTAWQTILLAKAPGTGNYYAGGPFVGDQPASLWQKRVVVTPQMTAGVALVGAFGLGGQIFRKGGLTVDASNSHMDFFQRNQTALRAEERLALAVYRPGAFGTVTAL